MILSAYNSVVSMILIAFVFGFMTGAVIVGSVDDKIRKDAIEEVREELESKYK